MITYYINDWLFVLGFVKIAQGGPEMECDLGPRFPFADSFLSVLNSMYRSPDLKTNSETNIFHELINNK